MRVLKRYLPTPEHLRANRALAWLAPAFADARLWAFKRRSVAIGLAVGLFFGLLIPVAQIIFAVVAAVILRGNVAIAAVTTLITNPLTFAPIYYVAYRLGAFILGEPALMPDAAALEREIAGFVAWAAYWLDRIAGVGKPLALGLAVLATLGAFVGYWAVQLGWRARVVLRRRRRAGADRRSS
jgi:uncharacterized protein (DUF2062 family)